MDFGLLWYDGDPRRKLEDKIGQAAQRYREKFGRWPNTCFVHPDIVNGHGDQELRIVCQQRKPRTTIRVLSAPNVLRHHYWLGISNGDGAAQRKGAVN